MVTLGLDRHRHIEAGQMLHRDALLRMRAADAHYAPPNITARFLGEVRQSKLVPDELAYVP